MVVPNRTGARNGGMSNKCELPINVVSLDKRKALIRLNQKVRGMVRRFLSPPTQSMIPPADRQALIHRVMQVEHGKPDCLPVVLRESDQ